MTGCHSTIAKVGTLLLVSLSVLGCSKRESTVSGSVSFAGKPLPHGYITFFPVEQEGTAAGTEIVEGRFTLRLPAGKRRMLVTTPPQASENTPIDKKPGLIHSGIVVPAGAVGNNQVIDVPAGEQTLNLQLHPSRTGKR